MFELLALTEGMSRRAIKAHQRKPPSNAPRAPAQLVRPSPRSTSGPPVLAGGARRCPLRASPASDMPAQQNVFVKPCAAFLWMDLVAKVFLLESGGAALSTARY
jgi:hypothetical protein